MPIHEFGIMQNTPMPGEIYKEYQPERYNCIEVDDTYIENIMEKLNDLTFYWNSIDRKNKGLAYCGITLIPPETCERLAAITAAEPHLLNLTNMLISAHKEHKFMIHFGI